MGYGLFVGLFAVAIVIIIILHHCTEPRIVLQIIPHNILREYIATCTPCAPWFNEMDMFRDLIDYYNNMAAKPMSETETQNFIRELL